MCYDVFTAARLQVQSMHASMQQGVRSDSAAAVIGEDKVAYNIKHISHWWVGPGGNNVRTEAWPRCACDVHVL